MTESYTSLRMALLSEPKHGHSLAEYEDASAANMALGRFAIADGTTESSFAGLWARMLVDEFVNPALAEPQNWTAWLPALQTSWEIAVGQQPMPWFTEIKWQQGAFSTFLGVIVRPPLWQAMAVGDSCLFHIRGGNLLRAFPVQHTNDFDCSPWLVGSRGFTAEMMLLREQRTEGEFADGDRLWLMTDALAQWFLNQCEHAARPWEQLQKLLAEIDPPAAFKAWVAGLRGAGQIRNDDITLLSIST